MSVDSLSSNDGVSGDLQSPYGPDGSPIEGAVLRRDWHAQRAEIKRLTAELANIKESAAAVAVLALQGNDYHRGDKDFRDAVDDVLFLTNRNRRQTVVETNAPLCQMTVTGHACHLPSGHSGEHDFS